MRHTFAGASLSVFIAWNVFCQSAAPPAFEVASVKANPNGRGRQLVQVSPGSLSIKKANLQFYILWAYAVRRDQIVCPQWFKTELYDVVAKAAGPAPEAELRLMMQKLLADRFKLTFHRETQTLSVYEMVVAKGGPKLIESKLAENVQYRSDRGAYQLPHTSMGEFATILVELGAVSLPVADRTGIPGFFDITLTFPEGTRPMDRPDILGTADIFGIMEKQLGLKLEERKMPTEILVIDHAERVPTEN
jgi:uncharacterized protein (TIGR03435 family)